MLVHAVQRGLSGTEEHAQLRLCQGRLRAQESLSSWYVSGSVFALLLTLLPCLQMGIDPNTGCVAVGDTVHLGQRIKFMVSPAFFTRKGDASPLFRSCFMHWRDVSWLSV